MLVAKIIYFTFAFGMALIDIFWFTQKLSQQKVWNYLMGVLGLLKFLLIAMDFGTENFTPKIIQVITEPLFTISVGFCALFRWRTKHQ